MPGPAIISVLIVLIVQQRFSTEHSTPRARWGVVGVVRCWCCPLLVLSAAGVNLRSTTAEQRMTLLYSLCHVAAATALIVILMEKILRMLAIVNRYY